MPVTLKKDADTARSPNLEEPAASDEDARTTAEAGKQPQSPTVDPSDDDFQDHISAVQRGAKPTKEPEAIFLSSDSDPSSNDYVALPRQENSARKLRSYRSFRIFDFDSELRTYLPRAVKKSAPRE